MKLILARLFSLIFVLQIMFPTALAAQLTLQTTDLEPPSIFFDKDATEITAGLNIFNVEVTDNIGVSSVTLFYRSGGDISYSSKTMTNVDENSNVYTAEIYIDSVITKKLEIYLKAEDVSGISVLEGEVSAPLSFAVTADTSTEVVKVGDAAEPEEEGTSVLTWVLIGLGVAALAGGGGGGSGGGSSDNPGTLTITTDLPN